MRSTNPALGRGEITRAGKWLAKKVQRRVAPVSFDALDEDEQPSLDLGLREELGSYIIDI